MNKLLVADEGHSFQQMKPHRAPILTSFNYFSLFKLGNQIGACSSMNDNTQQLIMLRRRSKKGRRLNLDVLFNTSKHLEKGLL